jgi:hypothetical protein
VEAIVADGSREQLSFRERCLLPSDLDLQTRNDDDLAICGATDLRHSRGGSTTPFVHEPFKVLSEPLAQLRSRLMSRVEQELQCFSIDIAGPSLERSLSDATHGNCHLLLALGPTIERLTAFAEVIERCGDRIVLGYRPVDSVCLQPVVLSINGAIATQHGIEA